MTPPIHMGLAQHPIKKGGRGRGLSQYQDITVALISRHYQHMMIILDNMVVVLFPISTN